MQALQTQAKVWTDELEALRERLVAVNAKYNVNYAAVAVECGVSRTTISEFSRAKRCIPATLMTTLEACLTRIEMEKEADAAADQAAPIEVEAESPVQEVRKTAKKALQTVEIYESNEYKLALGWCEHIRMERSIGAIFGHPGVGKTTVIKHYAANTPGVILLDTWPKMRMSDFLGMIGSQLGVQLNGSAYNREQQIRQELTKRKDIMFVIDEAEYLRTWDVDKFEALRKLWDATGTPIILCGTMELKSILRRGSGKENLAQLYSRIDELELRGIGKAEIRDMLKRYDVAPDAVNPLIKIATDTMHGGMRNYAKVLKMCLKAAGGEQVTLETVESSMRFKLMYN